MLTPYLVKLQQLLKNNARRHFLEWKFSTRIYWNTWKLPKRNLLFQLPKVLIIFVISGVRPGKNMVCTGRIININSHYQNFYCVCCVVSSCFPIMQRNGNLLYFSSRIFKADCKLCWNSSGNVYAWIRLRALQI